MSRLPLRLNQKIFEMGLNNNPTFKPQIAQIADEDSYLKTFPLRKFTQEGTGIMLRRYKIRICSMHDKNTPITDLPWAYGQSPTAGLRGESVGTPFYAANTFVTVFQDPETGLFYIDNVHPNSIDVSTLQSSIGLKEACAPGSGFIPGSPNYFVPQTHYIKGKLVTYGEWGSIPRPSDEDDAQDKLNETITLPSKCRKLDTDLINKEIIKLVKQVQDLKKELLGKDSFLVTSQKFLNDAQTAVSRASVLISDSIAWVINEMRKYVIRKTNSIINNLVGNAPLSTRYLVNETADKSIKLISCLFTQVLQNLESLISQILGSIINKIITSGVCLVEGIIGNLIGQLLNKITSAINGILGPLSNVLGSVISFTSEVLDFVISILDIFTCKIKNVCPVTEEWNFLEGGKPSLSRIDFAAVFNSAKGIVDSAKGLVTAPNINGEWDINLNVSETIQGALNSCVPGGFKCGPPKVNFWGGSGSGATGNAVVGLAGEVIGVDIITPGNYSSPPYVSFDDPCGNGRGAVGTAVLGGTGGDGTGTAVDGTGTGVGGDGTTADGTGVGGDGTGTGTTADGTGVGGDETGTVVDGSGQDAPIPDAETFPIDYVVIDESGYSYDDSSDGSVGDGTSEVVGRCQTIVTRANGDIDPFYDDGDNIKLFYGDTIKMPGKDPITIDCNWTLNKLPGSIQYGDSLCLKDMSGFDDGYNLAWKQVPIKSMVGFDDIRGSSPRNTPPISFAHQQRVNELLKKQGVKELLVEERELVNAGLIQAVGRPDQFGFTNDYPYAKELGFTDTDIRFYLEGFYTKLLGKRLGPVMKYLLDDPNFGPLPKFLKGGENLTGVFDYENDYPYAVSLGYTDQDIRFYLENNYPGEIADDMQAKLNDPNWGRLSDFFVTFTAPPCPDDGSIGVIDGTAGAGDGTNTYSVVPEIDRVIIGDGGFGYSDGDTATVLDCNGNPDNSTLIQITVEGGRIVGAKVMYTGSYLCIPKIIINTSTGHNAILKPIMRFAKVGDTAPPSGTSVLQVVNCVGRV